MDELKFIAELWYIKLLVGIVITIFAPIQMAFFALLILIIIDTITGIAQAVRFKRFRSSFLRKAVNKTILYGLCIITIRLLEQGILYFFNTTVISQITLGFLIVTEVISILENLVLLGVPLPTDFLTVLLKNIKVFGLENIVRQSLQDFSESKEIDEIIHYQIPTLNNLNMRKILEIKFEVWSQIVLFIKRNIGEENINNKDILYYKIMSIIESSNKEMIEKWKDHGISESCIEKFDKWHQPRVNAFLQNLKTICYSEHNLADKKQELINSLLTLLYQTIVDAHKIEAELCCGKCKAI